MKGVISLSEAGMINTLHRLTLISHNLANATTNGFRRDIAVSEPFLASLERLGGSAHSRAPTGPSDYMVPRTKSVLDVANGSLRHTANPLDFAIEGEGYFEFAGQDGVYFSRRGVFSQDAAGNLVTADGLSVQGLSGPLRLSNTEPRVDQNGVIWINEENVGQLKIVRFNDPSMLEKAGNNYFRLGQASLVEGVVVPKVRQGYIEGSNVDVMSEMVGMMTALRHLEITQRLVTGYDEIIGTAIETIGEY